MTEPKTHCHRCGTEFLQRTADANRGLCRKCGPVVDHEAVAEKIEISARMVAGVFFGLLFAVFGYGIGAAIWAGIGVVLALVCFPFGLVYGFFCREINRVIGATIRAMLPSDLD